MGKDKKGQRTKGNLRPSSSSRAAEELAASGTPGGFVGFGALSGDLGYVPASQGLAGEDDSAADADFRLVLRKISKRDATTKLKALQEFAILCKEKSPEDVKSVLPFWPRIYSRVSIDFDRRVREASQQAFEQLVLRVRKSLAPHLKSLMGPWIVSQCDVYAPSASAAKVAFQTAFPPAKQTEALLYCKQEILQHISENIFKQTAQTLSDPKSTDPEDMEAKYLRVITSSLLALRLFMLSVPKDDQTLIEKYRDILKENKFWKYAKHSSNLIKGAFYSCLATVCKVHPDVANEYSDKICPVVLHNLDESDPAVCPAIWEATLYVVSTINDCWEKVNARKGVLPKLWNVLKNGGNGSATVIYPNLLPFMGKIPSDIIGEDTGFYKAWFDNMKQGLTLEKVLVSPSECNAIVNCFTECIKYGLHQSIGSDNRLVTDFLIQDQLYPLLEASWLEKNPALSHSPMYSATAETIASLHKLSAYGSTSKNETAENVEKILWDGLVKVVINHVETVDAGFTIERIGAFVCAFVEVPTSVAKKSVKLRFADVAEDDASKSQIEETEKIETNIGRLNIQDFPNSLPQLVCKVCVLAINKSQDVANISQTHLMLFDRIYKTYVSDILITNIMNELRGDESEGKHAAMDFTETTILPWIQNVEIAQLSSRVKTDSIKCLVNISVSTSRLLASAQKVNMLSYVMRQTSVKTLYKFVEVFCVSGDQVVAKWVKEDGFGKKMVAIARSLCEHSLNQKEIQHQDDIDASWQLLAFGMSTDQNFEPVIGCSHMEEILSVIREALPLAGQLTDIQHTESCVSFVCRVAAMFFTNIKGCLMMKSAEELLLAITQLTCHPSLMLSEELFGSVMETCELGVKSLLYQKGGFLNEDGYFAKIASHIKFQVLNTADTIDRVCLLGKIARHICTCMSQHFEDMGETGSPNPAVIEFIKLLAMPFMHSMLPEWSDAVVVSNELLLSSIPGSPFTVSSTLPKCLATIAFTSSILSSVGQPEPCDGENPAFLYHMLDMLYGAAFCRSTKGQRDEDKSELVRAQKILNGNFCRMLDVLGPEHIKTLCEEAIDKSICNGQLWSLGLKLLASQLSALRKPCNWLEMCGGSERFGVLVEPSLNTLQALMPYMSRSETTQFAEIQAAQVMCCDPTNIANLSGGAGYLCVFNTALALQDSPMGNLPVDLNPDVVLSVLSEVQMWREQNEDLFIFDTDIRTVEWSVVGFNTQALKLMALAIEKMPTKLTDKHWDFIMCSLVSWVQSCQESIQDLKTHIPTKTICSHVFTLVAAVAKCIQSVLPQNADDFPPNLATEWQEFFSESTYSVLLPMFVNRCTSVDSEEKADDNLVTKAICLSVSHSPVEHVKAHNLPAKLVAGEDTHLPDEMQTLLNYLCPLLTSRNRAVQFASYKVLIKVMSDLSKFDEGHEVSEDAEVIGESSRSLSPALVSVLNTCTTEAALALGDTPMGDTCRLQPHSNEHTHCMAYLFTWKLILAFFKGATSELRAQYAYHLRETKAVDVLMLNLFRLMPEHPILQLKESLTSQNASQKLAGLKNLFSEEPILDLRENATENELGHLACSVYMWTLQDLPAIIRQWWNDQDKQTAGIIETYTMKYVSPIISTKELSNVTKQDNDSENMTIKARTTTKEVVATYTVDEVSMELVVSLAGNHPLGTIAVESGRRVGVANQEWRNWMLQLTTYLNHQNGTILDGLSLWKKNVDKKFEGIEECFICFSVINATNCQLPKPQCRTCKKRFHSACLYKWFNTSNKSTCPLCRNLF